MKIYARQINPEYQKSPSMLDAIKYTYPGIVFVENRNLPGYTTQEYDDIVCYIADMAHDWENRGTMYSAEEALKEMLNAYGFNRPDNKPWTAEQRRVWIGIFESDDPESNENICTALELLTGKTHDVATIRGCCQGDWQEIFYPVAEYGDALDIIAADYFNTGTEWIIHDGDDDPESAEDITGYGMYCYSWDAAKEIAAEHGADESDIVLYEWAGYSRTPIYKKAGA